MVKKIRLLILVFITFCIGVLAQNSTNANAFKKFIKEAQAAEQEMNATKACIAYEKAVFCCRSNPNISKKLPVVLFQYGSVLTYAGEYAKALKAFEESMHINTSKEKPDALLEARTYMQLGVLNFFQEYWDESLYYYTKAKEKAKEIKNEQGLSIAINNIANVYQKKGDYAKAILGYQESLVLQKKLKDTATLCNTYFNIGTSYEELHQEKKAFQYFDKSYILASAINDVEIKALSLIHKGNAFVEQGNYKKAKTLLNQAEEIVKKLGYRQVLGEVYKVRIRLYKKQDDYKGAFTVHKQYQKLLDSISSERLKAKTKELDIRLQTREKEEEIREQKIKINSRNRLLWLLGIFSFIGFVFTYTIYRLWRLRNRQNEKLKRLNHTKDKLFSIISHDLKAPAIAQKMAIENIQPQVETLEDENIKKYCKILHKNTENQVAIIENLMNWASVQSERIKYIPKPIDIIVLINDEINLYKVPAQNKLITLVVNMPKKCIVFADRQMIGIVVRNLINNAVKFTNTGGCISINGECRGKEFVFSITDDGVGMTPEQIKTLYTSEQRVKVSFGTKGEKGTGLGLILCKDLLERNNSRLLINSEPQKGTTMYFSLQIIEN